MKDVEVTPFFSVVVPVYKTPLESLYYCLKQVLNGAYENFEMIIVLDEIGSNLKSELKEKYSDDRVKILEQEHKGLGSARNAGMKIAKGEYLLFLDADDILLPESFVKLHEKICGDEVLDVILFPWQNYMNKPYGPTYQSKNDSHVNVAVWNKCYRVEYLKKIEFEVGVLYEDILFTFQAVFKTCSIGRLLGAPLYLYRVNKEASITANMDNQKHALALIKSIIDSRHDVTNAFSERDVLAYIYFCWKFHLDAALKKKDIYMLKELMLLGNLIPGFPLNACTQNRFFSS